MGGVAGLLVYIKKGLLVDEALLIKKFEIQKDFFVSNIFSLKTKGNLSVFKK